MNLAVDIGNTRTKAAVFENDKQVAAIFQESLTNENLQQLFTQYPITQVIISTVRGLEIEMENFLQEKSKLLVLTEHTPLPIKNLYKSADTLGKDRLAGVVGAYALHPENDVLVIDAGTCITYDFINAKGEFLGGGISPGLNIRFKALNNYTKNLPLLETADIDFFIGTNTKESILSGVINGVVQELNGIIGLYEKEYPAMKIIITGGDSKFLVSRLKSNIFAVPDLVLSGLNKILQHNAS